MISEKLAEGYNHLEDKYFDLLDFLDGRGLPVYAYSDFFEKKGIPSFLATISIVLLLLILISAFFLVQPTGATSLTLTLRDADGNPLQNALVTITDPDGKVLFNGTQSDGDTITLPPIAPGTKLTLSVSKNGYGSTQTDFILGKLPGTIRLSKEYESASGRIILVDNETKTKITGATVIATLSDASYEFIPDSNGNYNNSALPAKIQLSLSITADGYNAYHDIATFNPAETKTIFLTPSNQSLVGKAALSIVVKDENGLTVDNAKVLLYNKNTSTLLIDDFTRQGAVMGTIEKGIPLRLVIKKDGFLTYDSDALGTGITLREAEKQWEVFLTRGGQNIPVSVIDSTSAASIENAIVQVFDSTNAQIDRQVVTAAADTAIKGLDSNQSYFVTASADGYLAETRVVNPSMTDKLIFTLEKATTANSNRVDVYTIDELGNPVSAADLTVVQVKDGNKMPYGVDGLRTSIAGYVFFVARNGTYEISANTEGRAGTVSVTVGSTSDNKAYITMKKKSNFTDIQFLLPTGEAVIGKAKITGLDGRVLYDGNITNGKVTINSQDREKVLVRVTLSDGNLFSDTVTVKGKDLVKVVVYLAGTNALTPIITFTGLENENGDTVQGITPGAFYFADFSILFPAGASVGGVHFRTGDDALTLAESDTFNLYALQMNGADVVYSDSYTATPTPGNEVVDRSNVGNEGEANKWAEGTIDSPTGVYTAKVKVRANDFLAGKVPIHYRAWSTYNDKVYRTPLDTTLDMNVTATTKSPLYAETSKVDLTLYESLPDCTDSLCASFNFVDDTEKFYDLASFSALAGHVYGLEATFTSTQADYIQVSASSDQVTFLGTQLDSFSFGSKDSSNPSGYAGFRTAVDANDTSAAVSTNKEGRTTFSINKDGKQRVRLYFRAEKAGAATISFKATGKSAVDKQILFPVTNEKSLLVDLSASVVQPGKNFTVKITQSDGKSNVTGALIAINDKQGKVVKSILGDNTDGKGANGLYKIINDLDPGLYEAQITLNGYTPKSVPFMVSADTVLVLPDTVEAKVAVGQSSVSVQVPLENTSDFRILDVTSTTGASDVFSIKAVVPSLIGKLGKQSIPLTITYNGVVSDSADESIAFTVRGLVEGKFVTTVSTNIHIVYNKKLDAACLKFNPSTVAINLLGTAGSNDSAFVEVTNDCQQSLTLYPRLTKSPKIKNISVTVDPLIIASGETRNISVTASNAGIVSRTSTFAYEFSYDSNDITKRLPVTVTMINPTGSLSCPGDVTLFLSQNTLNGKAVDARPLFVSNISGFPIDNITFAINTQYSQGIDLRVEPSGAVSLDRGQAIVPAKVLFAQATGKESKPVEADIIISGNISELNNRSGQRDNYGLYNTYLDPYGQSNTYTNLYGQNSAYGNTYGQNNAYGQSTAYATSASYNSGSNYYANGTGLNSSLANMYPRSNGYSLGQQQLCSTHVTAVYSGYDCLKASKTEALYFNLSGGAQVNRRVQLKNECAEPVLITGVTLGSKTITSMGQSNAGVVLMMPSVVVGVGQILDVPLSVFPQTSFLQIERQKITIHGVTEISQSPIQNDQLEVKIDIGQKGSSSFNKATKNSEAAICSSLPTTTSASIPSSVSRVPITQPQIATSSGDCSTGYCDAKQAIAYIAKKVQLAISRAKSQNYAKADSAATFGCETTGYCSFGQIDLSLEKDSFPLYLQNDILGVQGIQDVFNAQANYSTGIRGEASLTGSYRVEEVEINDLTEPMLKQRVMSYPNQVFIDHSISGCGYYEISVTGAFSSVGGSINYQNPVVLIKATPITDDAGNVVKRVLTKECTQSIVNIRNFAPVDEGYTIGDDKGTWMTTIESKSTILDELGRNLALGPYFKAKLATDRFGSGGKGNTVTLSEGSVPMGLAQVCLEGSDRKNIKVTVDSQLSALSNSADKKNFLASVQKMVESALAGSFSGGCLVQNSGSDGGYSCVVLQSLSQDSGLTMRVPSKTINYTPIGDTGSCTNATVSSRFPQMVDVYVKEFGKGGLPGVKTITIEDMTSATQGQTSTTSRAATTAPTTSGQAPLAKKGTVIYQLIFNGKDTPIILNTAPIMLEKRSALSTTTPSAGTSTTVPTPSTSSNIPLPTTGTGSSTTSADALYTKQLRICISAGNSTATTNTAEYVKANEHTFTVIAKGRSGDLPQTADDDGKITISTGTLHPNDLFEYLGAKRSLIQCYSSDKPCYFTIMWKKDPINPDNFVDLASNMQAYLNTTGITVKDSQSIQAKEAQKKALTSYLKTCVITSEACNIGTSMATLGGALIAAPIMDCVVPMGITFKDQLYDYSIFETLFKSLDYATSWIPGFSTLFKKSTTPEATQPLSWQPVANAAAVRTIDTVATNGIMMGKALNTGVISFIEDQSLQQYKTPVEDFLKKINPELALPANAAKLSEARDAYLNYVVKEIQTPALQKSYADGLAREWAINPTNDKSIWFRDVGVTKGDAFTTAMTDARSKMFTSDSLKKFLIEKKTASGDSWFKGITGLDPTTGNMDAFISKTSIDLKNTLSGQYFLSSDNIATKVSDAITKNTAGIYDATGNVINIEDVSNPQVIKKVGIVYPKRALTYSEIEGVVQSTINDSVKATLGSSGLTDTEIKGVINSIINDIAGNPNIALKKGLLTAKIQDSLSPTNLQSLKVPGTTTPLITTKITGLGDKEIKTISDEAAKIMSADAAKAADKVASAVEKRSFLKRSIQSLSSKGFWKEMGRGVGCGILANSVAMYSYNNAVDAGVASMVKDPLPQTFNGQQLEWGKTYKMVVKPAATTTNNSTNATETRPESPLLSEVSTPEAVAQMLSDLSDGKDGSKAKGTRLVWALGQGLKSEGTDGLAPEERMLALDVYGTTNRKLLETKLVSVGGLTDSTDPNNPNSARALTDEMYSDDVQRAVHTYVQGNKQITVPNGTCILKTRDAVAILAPLRRYNLVAFTPDEVNTNRKSVQYWLEKGLTEMNKKNCALDEVAKNVMPTDTTSRFATAIIKAWDISSTS